MPEFTCYDVFCFRVGDFFSFYLKIPHCGQALELTKVYSDKYELNLI